MKLPSAGRCLRTGSPSDGRVLAGAGLAILFVWDA